jgi:hypothetical protein
MPDIFGTLVGPWSIEKACLSTLTEWMGAYLANIEIKEDLEHKFLGRPPAPESYKGGLDWESVRQELLPAVIVNANPTGEPERNASSVIQNFEVQVGCVVLSEEGTEPEALARMRAGLMATATMLLEHQAPALEGLEEIVFTGAPRVEFFDPERREIAVGITTWHVYAQILTPTAGPEALKEVEPEGPYPENPEATSDHVVVVGEPLDTPL